MCVIISAIKHKQRTGVSKMASDDKQIKWTRLKNEYIKTDITLKDLAKKHNLTISSVSKYAASHKWTAQREKYWTRVESESLDRDAHKEADRLGRLKTASDKLSIVIDKLLDDTAQFNRHLIQHKEKTYSDDESTEKEWVEEEIFQKADSKAIRDLAASMKDLSLTIRQLHGLPTMQEAEAMRIAAARLELDRKKQAFDDGYDDDDHGVVLLPAVSAEEPDTDDDDEEPEVHENDSSDS